jgi:NAD(P)H-hydrate epimerase
MRPVLTSAQMRELDRQTIDEVGVPGVVLMETAGRAVAACVERHLSPGSTAVVCGPGNNGGDGFACARVLHDHGWPVAVYATVPAASIRGDAALHLAIAQRAGVEVMWITDESQLAHHAPRIRSAAVVVDAVFGTGLGRPVIGHFAAVLDTLAQASGIKIAVDLPSGMDAETGAALGATFAVARTVCLGAFKPALVISPGFVRCGVVEVVDIGLPARVLASIGATVQLWEHEDSRRVRPQATPLEHKGMRGHVAVIAGGPGMRGAGRLAALGALRAGAGLVTLATVADDNGEVLAPDPVMTQVLTERGDEGDGHDLSALLAGKAAVVVGPGLGADPTCRAWVEFVLKARVPTVVDGGGLQHLASILATSLRGQGVVLTPHPKEAALLLGCSVDEVQRDRLGSARALARSSSAVVVLKGARTIVCDGRSPEAACWVTDLGGTALATAGSGDVLAGVVAGLSGQGLDLRDAACLGVWLHGRAGDWCQERLGERGVIASDLPEAVAVALASLR